MYKSKVIILIVALVVFLCAGAISLAEEVQRPIDVDNGRWVDLYADYLYEHFDYWYDGLNLPRVALLDLDLDSVPEMLALTEFGRWYNGGYIVKITENDIVEYYSPELIDMSCTLALAIDKDGNYGWYQEAFQAGTGLQNTTVRRLSVTSEMEPILEDWFSYSTEEIYNEDTDEYEMVNTGYTVGGNTVDYDTYRKEEIKRRQLRVLYTVSDGYPFPDEWETAINEYSVIK